MDNGVIDIDRDGVRLAVKGQTFFLPFAVYEWFKFASVAEIFDCRIDEWGDVEWPELDIALEYDSLAHPERYPVKMNVDKWLARRAARRLGGITSAAKTQAARANGKSGGRPKGRKVKAAKTAAN